MSEQMRKVPGKDGWEFHLGLICGAPWWFRCVISTDRPTRVGIVFFLDGHDPDDVEQRPRVWADALQILIAETLGAGMIPAALAHHMAGCLAAVLVSGCPDLDAYLTERSAAWVSEHPLSCDACGDDYPGATTLYSGGRRYCVVCRPRDEDPVAEGGPQP